MVLEGLTHKMVTPGLGSPGQGAKAFNFGSLYNEWRSDLDCLGNHISILFLSKDLSLPSLKLETKTYGHWKTVSSQPSGVLIPLSC